MPGLLLRILRDSREACVERSPSLLGQRGHGCGGEQRMRESEALAVQLDDARGDRTVDVTSCRLGFGDCGSHACPCRFGKQGGDIEYGPNLRRQLAQSRS